MNSQNRRLWAPENLHVIHEEPPLSAKIGAWRAVSRTRIIGPVFRGLALNFQCIFDQLTDNDLTTCYFQQDVTRQMQAWRKTESYFGGRIISKDKVPRFNAVRFFLWDLVKGKV
jgi:hypothetical protein